MAHSVNRCFFEWDVSNPFLPARNMKATFYHGSPSVTRWTVSLEAMDQRINYWRFQLSLKFDDWFKPRTDFVAERILITMHLDGKPIKGEEVPNSPNRIGYGFVYLFQRKAIIHPQTEPHRLVVRIEISLRHESTGNEVETGFSSAVEDLRWLSRDLKQLLKDSKCSNMKLIPSDGDKPILAHSYIVSARWNNFFKHRSFDELKENTVEIKISYSHLVDILNYMYSGEWVGAWQDRMNLSYTNELFRVMRLYELDHLHRVFWKSDLEQERATLTPVHIESHIFELKTGKGGPIKTASPTWRVNPKPEFDLVFQVRVGREDRAGPWLSYSLQSKSPTTVHAQVNLEIVRIQKGSSFQRITPLHERELVVEPEAIVKSEKILFLGCPDTLGHLNVTEETDVRNCIRCFLSVTDGTAVDQIRIEDHCSPQKDLEQIYILSDDMRKMKKQEKDSDMKIISRSHDHLNLKEVDRYLARTHKGICATRMHYFGGGLENVPEEMNDIPQVSATTLSREVLPFVLDYMYTGRMGYIPKHQLHEVRVFATKAHFYSLLDLVERTQKHYT